MFRPIFDFHHPPFSCKDYLHLPTCIEDIDRDFFVGNEVYVYLGGLCTYKLSNYDKLCSDQNQFGNTTSEVRRQIEFFI